MPFAPAGSVVHAFIATMTSSDSRSALPHFVGLSAYRVRRSQATDSVGTRAVSLLGRRRVSPVPTTALPPFHVPYAATPSMAFARSCQARLPVAPLRAFHNDAADFASCCGPVGCTFLNEGSTPRFDARISPNAGGLLQRLLGPSSDRTRTG